MATKRIRLPNYSNEEKMVLLNTVDKYKKIITSKKTDHATWKDKEDTWEKVAHEFNSVAPAGN